MSGAVVRLEGILGVGRGSGRRGLLCLGRGVGEGGRGWTWALLAEEVGFRA